ncbi:MAG: MAPEG family protein [Proteobacteria bacterium]|nr:MAPEG family protein [Pseudomonadota bacterium]
MTFPSVTATYAALFGLIFLGLTAWVIGGRARFKAHHGDGGEERLNRRIRAHANFAEYVPLILILVALLEGGGANRSIVNALLAPLLVARLAHPFGMVAPIASPQQFGFRGLSVIVTMLVLFAASLLLLARVL